MFMRTLSSNTPFPISASKNQVNSNHHLMKSVLILLYLLPAFLISSCSTSKINTVEFQTINYEILAEGDYSPANKKLAVVTFNRNFSLENFGRSFTEDNYLDTVNYRKSMVIQIFLGEKPKTGYNIDIDKIEENKDVIRVHYSVSEPDGSNSKPSQPYILVQVHDARKSIEYFENGQKLGGKPKSIYVN